MVRWVILTVRAFGLAITALVLCGLSAMAIEEAKVGEIVAAVPKDFPPHYSLSLDGMPQGYAVDVLNAVADLAGLSVTYRAFDTWPEVHAALKTGAADVIPNMGITPGRAAFADFTTPTETFDVVLARRTEDTALRQLDDLAGRTVATMGTNVAARILASRTHITVKPFETAKQVLDALLQGIVDGIALPAPLIADLTARVRVSDRITTFGEPLVTVRRAIAVARDRPDLRAALDEAVTAFVGSADHEDLKREWGLAVEPSFPLAGVIWGIAFATVVAAVIGVGLLRTAGRKTRDRLVIPETDGRELGRRLRRRGLGLTVILIVSVIGTVAVTLVLLYLVAFDKQRDRLVELVTMQTAMIEAVARFDARHSADYPGGAAAATLSQVASALERYQGIGELTLARREGDTISFILRQRAWDRYQPSPVPIDSGLAEPMREALMGRSGTLIGKDYRGVEVLAAYAPVPSLGIGTVAKVDLAEIRGPFIQAGLVVAAIGVVVLALGTAAFVAIGDPLVNQLIERERWFAAIVKHAGVGIALVDAGSGRIIQANDRFASVLGLSRDTLRSSTLAEMIPSLRAPVDAGNGRPDADATLPTAPVEIGLTQSDGRKTWCQVTVSPIADTRQDPDRRVLILDDITKRKQVEAMRDEMERIVRHDLRSPIVATLSGIEVLRLDHSLNDDQQRTLSMMERASRRQLMMLDTSLALHRMEAGTLEVDLQPLDVTTILEDVAAELDHMAKGRRADVRIAGGPGARVLADAWLCRAVFDNLIRNALEALPAEHERVDITVTPDAARVHVAISNPGAVPEEIRDRFFEKDVTWGKAQGSGLGTYSAAMMTRAQGGSITLDASAPDRTTVTVTLPRADGDAV